MKRFKLGLAAVAICATALVSVVHAADPFPTKPLRFVVPFPPGGSSDVLGRTVAQGLSQSLGQPVVVENIAGGGTTIGTANVVRSPADGHSLILLTTPTSINPSLRKSMPFDTLRDLIPVTVIASVPLTVLVKPSLPVSNMQELVALSKTRELSYGSSGVGGGPHLAVELLKSTSGARMVHVPFNGAAPALNGLAGGHVDVVFETVQASQPLVQGGKVKAIATTGAQRSSLFPDLPLVADQGFPGFRAASWMGVGVPAGTPPGVVERLNKDIVTYLNSPAVKKSLEDRGFQVIADSPASAAAFLRSEIEQWGKVVASSGATAE